MITAIIPTLNEEDFIEEAIASVSFADEVIVIDSFSTDRTSDIAKGLGVRVIRRRFDNFSSQKNYAIKQAKHDWIYILDADERLSPGLKSEILEATRNPGGCVAFYIYRTFYFKQTKINFGGWQTDKVIRLFQKEFCRYDGKLVHEKIEYKGKAGFLEGRIDHYSFRGIEQYMTKLDRYAHLQARELQLARKNIHFGYRWFKPGFRFFMHYVVRFGFLDGEEGYILAKLHARAVGQRYVQFDLLNESKIV